MVVLLQLLSTCERRHCLVCFCCWFFFHLRISNVFTIVPLSFPINHVPGPLHQVKGNVLPGNEVDFQCIVAQASVNTGTTVAKLAFM